MKLNDKMKVIACGGLAIVLCLIGYSCGSNNKNVEEVVIWDRYLSYAQVFGLTKEIMKSGYNQLVDNSSFKIDNIENINLDNIKIN